MVHWPSRCRNVAEEASPTTVTRAKRKYPAIRGGGAFMMPGEASCSVCSIATRRLVLKVTHPFLVLK